MHVCSGFLQNRLKSAAVPGYRVTGSGPRRSQHSKETCRRNLKAIAKAAAKSKSVMHLQYCYLVCVNAQQVICLMQSFGGKSCTILTDVSLQQETSAPQGIASIDDAKQALESLLGKE